MPIRLSQADIAKRGGTYTIQKQAPVIKAPPPPPSPPTPPVPQAPDPIHMERMMTVVSAGQEVAAEKLSQVIDLLGRSGGSWDVEVTERDEDGRISRLSFTKTL
jgi:hypothetical protein